MSYNIWILIWRSYFQPTQLPRKFIYAAMQAKTKCNSYIFATTYQFFGLNITCAFFYILYLNHYHEALQRLYSQYPFVDSFFLQVGDVPSFPDIVIVSRLTRTYRVIEPATRGAL